MLPGTSLLWLLEVGGLARYYNLVLSKSEKATAISFLLHVAASFPVQG